MRKSIIFLVASAFLNYAWAEDSAKTTDSMKTGAMGPIPQEVVSSNPYKITAHLSYNLADSLNTDSVEYSGVGFKLNGSATGDIDKALGVGVEATFTNFSDTLDFVSGLSYDFARSLKKITYNFNGTSIAGSLTTAKIAQIILYGNVKRAWEKHYLLAGLNLSMPSISGVQGSKVSSFPGLGYQIGAGYIINENVSFEGVYRITKFRLQENYPNLDFVDYQNTDLSGLVLNLRFLF